MKMGSYLCLVAFFSVLFVCAFCDTPANCTYEDIHGVWSFLEGERSGGNDINCKNFTGPIVNTQTFTLSFPDVATDQNGNTGFWTLVYNQGFEVQINYRKYFAFSKYVQDSPENVTSYCNEVFPGWSHDILGKNWACYNAHKIAPRTNPKVHYEKPLFEGRSFYKQDKDFVTQINKIQKSWTAGIYPELENMPISDLIRRSGGKKSRVHKSPPVTKMPSKLLKNILNQLPAEFDWRNVGGINYVSPVRNQGSCGSCFAFSSMGMLESRLRIATNNTVQVVFSPQDVVSCSEYAQGCEGGFPYLIAGKYAQDFGVVPEDCNPYRGKDDECSEKKCKRYYVADYKYVGGFYGASNEEVMKMELYNNGPISVSFEVYPDFQMYKDGIYHHTGLRSGFNPFMITNHAVLAVGYGVDKKTGENFWIVKNSWGTEWGEDGYFRIRRGTDECSIESLAVAVTPIP